MKEIFIMLFLIAAVPGYAQAKEVSYAEIAADPSRYVGKPVVMKGSFMYSEPMRESFTLKQGGALIEVFFSNLPGNDRQFILSLRKYSKAEVIVSGILKQYTNSAHSYFINASSLSAENSALPAPPPNGELISYADIQSEPARYLNKPVMMKGAFLYGEPARQSFTLDQNGKQIEIFLRDLSRIDRELVLSQKKYSRAPVTVTGVLQAYANNTKTYFINASLVILEN